MLVSFYVPSNFCRKRKFPLQLYIIKQGFKVTFLSKILRIKKKPSKKSCRKGSDSGCHGLRYVSGNYQNFICYYVSGGVRGDQYPPLSPPPKSLKGLEKTMPCAYCSEVVSYVIIVSYSKDCYKGEYIVQSVSPNKNTYHHKSS